MDYKRGRRSCSFFCLLFFKLHQMRQKRRRQISKGDSRLATRAEIASSSPCSAATRVIVSHSSSRHCLPPTGRADNLALLHSRLCLASITLPLFFILNLICIHSAGSLFSLRLPTCNNRISLALLPSLDKQIALLRQDALSNLEAAHHKARGRDGLMFACLSN